MVVQPLDIEWDELAGTVVGDGADYLQHLAASGSVPLHPQPASHTLSNSPLTSRVDMAAMIGWLHRLPAVLIPYYPEVGLGNESGLDQVVH